MRYTVRPQGVPIGTVELSDRELSAGALLTSGGYAAIRSDERVVVLARLSHAAASVPALARPRRGSAPDAA